LNISIHRVKYRIIGKPYDFLHGGDRAGVSKLFAVIERGLLDEAKGYVEELSKEAPNIAEIASARTLIKRKETIGL